MLIFLLWILERIDLANPGIKFLPAEGLILHC